MTDPNTEAVAVAICQALGLNPNEPATSPAPGLPGLRWTQFATAADAAISRARAETLTQESLDAVVRGLGEINQLKADLEDDRATTSARVAEIAARLMHHEDPDVRTVAASALVQRE